MVMGENHTLVRRKIIKWYGENEELQELANLFLVAGFVDSSERDEPTISITGSILCTRISFEFNLLNVL